MLVRLVLLFVLLLNPGVHTQVGSIELEYAMVDGNLVEIHSVRLNDTRYTNLGNASVTFEEDMVHIQFNSTVNATRYFSVNCSYSWYEVRNLGNDRDVVFDTGRYVLFFHTNIPLESNGSFIRFTAASFSVDIGVYDKGQPLYPLIGLSILILLIAITRKLFPNTSG